MCSTLETRQSLRGTSPGPLLSGPMVRSRSTVRKGNRTVHIFRNFGIQKVCLSPPEHFADGRSTPKHCHGHVDDESYIFNGIRRDQIAPSLFLREFEDP